MDCRVFEVGIFGSCGETITMQCLMMRLHWATCSKKPPGHRFQYIPRMSCGSAKANQSRLILQDFADPNQGFQGIAVHWGQYLIHKRYYDFVFRSGVWICSSCTFAIYLDTLRVCPDKLQTHTHTKTNQLQKEILNSSNCSAQEKKSTKHSQATHTLP